MTDNSKEAYMSEVKPVYQRSSCGVEWADITWEFYSRYAGADGFCYRILYSASVVEALQAENAAQANRIKQLEVAFNEWIVKTEFVQKDEDKLFVRYLGMHRADAMHSVILQQKKRIEDLTATSELKAHKMRVEIEALRKQVEMLKKTVPTSSGFCDRSGGCVCGGDLPRIRESCSNWVKSGQEE